MKGSTNKPVKSSGKTTRQAVDQNVLAAPSEAKRKHQSYSSTDHTLVYPNPVNLPVYVPGAIRRDRKILTPLETFNRARKGEASSLIDRVQKNLGITFKELADLLGFSETTLHSRRKSIKPIENQAVAEQLIQLESLAEHGKQLFKNQDKFTQWLRQPQWDLNDVPPFSFLRSSNGIMFVDEILGRIEHGLPI